MYTGNSRAEANDVFSEYVQQSRSGRGRAGNESVTMFRDGDIVREHFGSADED